MSPLDNETIDNGIEQILAEVMACVGQIPGEDLVQAGALMEGASRIFVAGAGRSGLSIRALGMRLMHLGKTVYVVGETTTPGIRAEELLVLGSASGRTAGLMKTAEQAKRQSARILLFTTDRNSPLAKLADHSVIIPAPSLKRSERTDAASSVQPMGTLFEQSLLILGDSLILGLKQHIGVTDKQMSDRHANLE